MNNMIQPKTPVKGLTFGDQIKDILSGAEGTIVVMSETATGEWHLAIESGPSLLKALPIISENRAEKTGTKTLGKGFATEWPKDFEIDQIVRLRDGEMEGRIRQIDYHLSGCTRYHIKTSKFTDLGARLEFSVDPDEIVAVEQPQETLVRSTVPETVVASETEASSSSSRRSPTFVPQASTRDQMLALGAKEEDLDRVNI